jgi:hypothetical protein
MPSRNARVGTFGVAAEGKIFPKDQIIPLDIPLGELSSKKKKNFCVELAARFWALLSELPRRTEMLEKVEKMKASVTAVVKENDSSTVTLTGPGKELHYHTPSDELGPNQTSLVFLVDIFGPITPIADLEVHGYIDPKTPVLNPGVCACYLQKFVCETFADTIVGQVTAERLLYCFALHRVNKDGMHYMHSYDCTKTPLPIVGLNMFEPECCICLTTIAERISTRFTSGRGNSSGPRFCPYVIAACPKGDASVCAECLVTLKQCPVCNNPNIEGFELMQPCIPKDKDYEFRNCDGCPTPRIVRAIRRRMDLRLEDELARGHTEFRGRERVVGMPKDSQYTPPPGLGTDAPVAKTHEERRSLLRASILRKREEAGRAR